VPEGDDTGGGAGGGAAAVEEEDFFAGTETPAAAPVGEAKPGEEKPAGEEKPGEEKPGEGAVAEWMKSFSGEKPGEGQLSNQEWLAKIGAKDLDDVVTRYRAAERGLRESGKVKVPGEGATEAEIAAYREAIGAPKEAGGYEVALPEGAKDVEIDAAFMDPFREIALKHNIPKAAFADLAAKFMESQYGSMVEEASRLNADKAAKVKEWGPEAEQRKEEFRRGMNALGLKVADISKIQTGFGAGATLDLFAKIGQLAGEDFFAGNGGRAADRFGVANAEGAKKAIDAMISDTETAKKLRNKDPVTVARYNRLTDALAHFRSLESKA
jgi:hypothetical protein